MGILSQQAIKRRIDSAELCITPPPTEKDYDSDAVDVHLGDVIYEWKRQPSGSVVTVSSWKKEEAEKFSYRKFSDAFLQEVPFDNAGIVTLRPHTFYLADVREHTKLPPDIAMHVQGKSSLARLGLLVHLTAPHAHAGWNGRLTLEMYNLGPFNIELRPDMAIGQLTFWKVEEAGSAAEVVHGQFSGQTNAKGGQAASE